MRNEFYSQNSNALTLDPNGYFKAKHDIFKHNSEDKYLLTKEYTEENIV